MKILFMGTPEFARICLAGLIDSGADIIGVVTQPDRPKGRGYALQPSAVKVYAQDRGYEVYQPQTLKDEAFSALLTRLNPDLIAVVAYGKLLPQQVLAYPRFGCVNVHSSLLPKYRGAAPMQRAIIDGQRETGITTMFMAQGLDTGDILEYEAMPIGENDTFEDVHDRLAAIGARLLPHTIHALEQGTIVPVAQDDSAACYAEKITKEDCRIDFHKNARSVHNLIRGVSPVPLAFTHLHGKLLKIVRSEVVCEDGSTGNPGEVISLSQGKICVACAQGTVAFTQVLPEGKGRMGAGDFIRGRKIAVGDLLGE